MTKIRNNQSQQNNNSSAKKISLIDFQELHKDNTTPPFNEKTEIILANAFLQPRNTKRLILLIAKRYMEMKKQNM